MQAVRKAVAEELDARLPRVRNDSDPEFLTVDEAAELLRLDRKTVYGMATRRELPGARKMGRVYRIHRPTLEGAFGASGPRSR